MKTRIGGLFFVGARHGDDLIGQRQQIIPALDGFVQYQIPAIDNDGRYAIDLVRSRQ